MAVVCALICLHQAVALAAAPCADAVSCEKACEAGEGAACTLLGHIYEIGRDDVVPNMRKACRAFERGCTAKSAESCVAAGTLLMYGWGHDVPIDPVRAGSNLSQALDLTADACATDKAEACYLHAQAALTLVDAADWTDDTSDRRKRILEDASAGCEAGSAKACRLVRSNAWASNDGTKLSDAAQAKLVEMCKAGEMRVCADLLSSGSLALASHKGVAASVSKACKNESADACIAEAYLTYAGSIGPEDDPAKRLLTANKLIVKACAESDAEMCTFVGGSLFAEEFAKGVGADASTGLAILRRRCAIGDSEACLDAGSHLARGEGATADRVEATKLLERSCRLERPNEWSSFSCGACNPELDLDLAIPECGRRSVWRLEDECSSNVARACQDLGDRFAKGDGVKLSAAKAAEHYSLACGQHAEGACESLYDLCGKDKSLKASGSCDQPLIRSQLFDELEAKYRLNNEATSVSVGAGAAVSLPSAVVVAASTSAEARSGYHRGSLDADLVVSIVIDRARRAAIQVVADELAAHRKDTKVPTYMRDVLTYGSSLLSGATSLRRDVLQDLGATLVRAFVATTFVRYAFQSVANLAELVGGDVKTEVIAERADDLRAFLADAAYWALGSKLWFSRAGAENASKPECPFDAKEPIHRVCDAVDEPDKAMVALHVDWLFDGIEIARTLQKRGDLDVRGLIEAVSGAKTIGSFTNTPGLSLDDWRQSLIYDLGGSLARFRTGLSAAIALTNPVTYGAKGPPIEALHELAADLRSLLGSDYGLQDEQLRRKSIVTVLGEDLVLRLVGIVDALQAPTNLEVVTLADVQEHAKAALNALGEDFLKTLRQKLSALDGQATEAARHVGALGDAIESLRATFESVGGARLSIDTLKLNDMNAVVEKLRAVLSEMNKLAADAKALLPRVADLHALEMLDSTVVRLLSFLDLLAQFSSAIPRSLTCFDVMKRLRTLGGEFDGSEKSGAVGFAAPLFDLLEPILATLESKEPLSIEQVFGVLADVRLDTLATTIVKKDPCDVESAPECWVFKIAYSLQSAIQHEETVRLDGDAVAAQLAAFGDDFKNHHRAHWYFHLTVGVGSLYVPDAGMPSSDLRAWQPLISEQVGVGRASRSYCSWSGLGMGVLDSLPFIGWLVDPAPEKSCRGRFTLKTGVAASGILYRMIVDSKESDAIMGTGFVAVDVAELLELYAGPTALFYAPSGDQDAFMDLGWSVGASVPLDAYLEKL